MYRKFRSIFDGVTETVKSEIKKQKGGVLAFLMAPKASSLIASVAFSLLPGIFAFFGVTETEFDKKVELFL